MIKCQVLLQLLDFYILLTDSFNMIHEFLCLIYKVLDEFRFLFFTFCDTGNNFFLLLFVYLYFFHCENTIWLDNLFRSISSAILSIANVSGFAVCLSNRVMFWCLVHKRVLLLIKLVVRIWIGRMRQNVALKNLIVGHSAINFMFKFPYSPSVFLSAFWYSLIVFFFYIGFPWHILLLSSHSKKSCTSFPYTIRVCFLV